jgi:hypothetical protein
MPGDARFFGFVAETENNRQEESEDHGHLTHHLATVYLLGDRQDKTTNSGDARSGGESPDPLLKSHSRYGRRSGLDIHDTLLRRRHTVLLKSKREFSPEIKPGINRRGSDL